MLFKYIVVGFLTHCCSGPKNFKLLSFGDEAEAEEAENTSLAQTSKNKSKSFHDLGDDPNMVSKTAIPVKEEPASPTKEDEQEDVKPSKEIQMDFPKPKEERGESDEDDESFESRMREKVRRKLEKAARDKFGENAKEKDKGGEKRARRWDATEVTAAKKSEEAGKDKGKKAEKEDVLGDDEYSLAKKAKKGLEPRARQAKGEMGTDYGHED